MIIEWIIHHSNLVIAISTSLLCVLTGFHVLYTKKLLEQQSRPKIVVSATPDEIYGSLINYRIENIGLGVAKNVRFDLIGEFPPLNSSNASGEGSKFGPLTNGVSFLPPSERLVFLWGEFSSLREGIGEKPLRIRCAYYSMSDKFYSEVFPISINHHALTYTRTAPLQQIADSLKKIGSKF
jgi:hypothetical protein